MGAQVDIMPARGTHEPVSKAQWEAMFEGIAYEKMLVHDWRHDVVRIGEVPASYPEKITEKLKLESSKKLSSDNIVVYEVRLQVSTDGINWVDATAEDFPKNGLEISFTLPNGITAETAAQYDFIVSHMKDSGEVELLTPALKDGKLVVTVSSLSPFGISWKLKEQPKPSEEPKPTQAPTATPAPSDTPEASASPEATPAAGSKTDPSQIDFHGEPFIVTQSSVGRTFDVAEAEKAWAAASYGDTVTIPMTVTKPEHTTEEINDMLFRDALSKNWTLVRLWNRDYCNEVRTSLSGSSADRISNVKKACGLLDGLVLIPGQTLSFNDTLGERTEANGWKPATAYANGEVRQEYGGGICQVSSTLYNAALYANLEIVERACHQFQVGYLPWGMDATVSWGWPDFKFRNDAEYPVKIHAWVDEETNECCVQILGTDVKHQYVLMQFNNWEVFDETGTYFDANGNPLSVGMAAATWRLVFNDGDDYNTATPISKEYEAYSTYNYHTEDIEARNVPQG